MGLGDRLRSIRKRRGLSQRELAAESRVSLSLIRKIEQDEVTHTRLETLRKLATALRVPTTTLATEPDAHRADAGTVAEWESVRRALVGQVEPIEETPTAEGVDEALTHLKGIFRSGHYSAILPLLPALIRDADALGTEGRPVRTKVLTLTGWLLTHTHQYDAAGLVLDRALDDAPGQLEGSAVMQSLSWMWIRRGELDRCGRLATQWADDLEPRMSKASDSELAAWGWMLIRVSMSAVRDNRPGEARDAIRLARASALVIGREILPDQDFLRPFGPAMVTAKAAELAMIEDQPEKVLALADTIPHTAVKPTSANWNRHLLDVAHAQARLGRTPDALGTLHRIRGNAPEWLAQQRYARDVLGYLISRRRTLTPEMRELADAVRLEY